MVRTGDEVPRGVSAMIIEDGTEGLSFGANERKMGWRAQPTAQVQFDDCKVPADHLLGEEGKGFKYAMAGLDGGRLNIAASALGAAQAALNTSVQYAKDRKAFGKSIADFQSLQFKLADMETELEAARALLYQAAWKLDNKARRMPRNTAPWPSGLSPTRPQKLPMTHCRFMAVTAILPTTASRKSSAICGCTKFSKAPTRSCG